MELGRARTPRDMRLYAIGDVHGMDAMLVEAHEKIADDLAARQVADHRIVHIGDYVDRGADSKAVIDRLARLTAADPRVVCLMGNHDEMMLAFLTDPLPMGPDWLRNGGGTTLRDYGIAVPAAATRLNLPALAARLVEAMPPAHRAFLDGLRRSVRFGDFFFCHGGIRPGVALDSQTDEDLVWMREPFLSSDRDHGAVVVHGHTPQHAPEVRPNRINIDTGAVYGGPLTVLALEDTAHRFL